jgi:hypothetical protein
MPVCSIRHRGSFPRRQLRLRELFGAFVSGEQLWTSCADPNRINLRYETPANRYLMANLLSPAAAGTLSQPVSQQEYAKLFQRDRLGPQLLR